MLFNSYVFLFLFLPLVLLGWYSLNRARRYRAACVFLTGMSLWFYAYFNYYYLFIILASIAVNYGLSGALAVFEKRYGGAASDIRSAAAKSCAETTAARGTAKPHAGTAAACASAAKSRFETTAACDNTFSPTPPLLRLRRLFLALGLAANLGIFFYFKYYDFFIENINALFGSDFTLKHILLPLGISFFTFQQLSFIIDRARGRARHYPLVSYATFVTFFPQLIAGPIVLYDEMMPQFENVQNRRFQSKSFARGVVLFVLGLAKKVLLADVLALPANYGFASAYYLDTGAAALTLLSYAFELYFDFSGYCDMAMGFGKMFNIELPENFDAPYRACTVKELWNRWHKTLTRFFTQYVYFPLGGSRRGAPRTVLNILLVFALSGLWHGANWTFIVWGLMQGALVVWDTVGLVAVAPASGQRPAGTLLSRTGRRPLLTVPRAVGGVCTFAMFTLSLVFFRSSDLTYAGAMLRRLCIPLWPGWILRTAQTVELPELYVLTKGVQQLWPAAEPYVYLAIWLSLLAFGAFLILTQKKARTIAMEARLTGRFCFGIALLFVWCVASLSQVSTFLYFNF